MADPLRILAEPMDATTCTFTVERPVLPERAVRFACADAAKGSPLAEALFAVPGVASVAASGRKLVVKKSGSEEWGTTARAVGAAIREKVLGGGALFTEEALKGTPKDEEMRGKVLQTVETEINPVVAGHGGHIDVVDVKDGVVFVVMAGGCQGCGMAHITLRQGVERLVKERLPEVSEVVDVTDHGGGMQPFVPRQAP
jgi:Fe-S cluster biogenesis protein NfuA